MKRSDWLKNIPNPAQLASMKRNISAARTPQERIIRAEAFLRNSTGLYQETIDYLKDYLKQEQLEEKS